MPILPNHIPAIKQFYMPSTAHLPKEEQSWVKIDMSPATTGDLLLYSDADNMDARFLKWLVSRIIEWNWHEADGRQIPVDFASILRLPKVDYGYLAQQHIKAISEQTAPELPAAEKKSSSSTLTP